MSTNENSIEEKREHYVYQLIDPRNDKPFYIGLGTGNRMYAHERLTKKNKISNNNKILFYKIKKILKLNLSIKYIKLESNLTLNEAKDIEISEIKKYGRINIGTGILSNLTDGGDGTPGRIFSEKTINKIRNTLLSKNLKLSNEHRLKLLKSHTGIKHTKEHRMNMVTSRLKNNGCWHAESTKRNISKSIKRLSKDKSYIKKLHDGWENILPITKLKDPCGKVYEIKCISRFVKENPQLGLSVRLYLLISGKIKSYKGWTLC